MLKFFLAHKTVPEKHRSFEWRFILDIIERTKWLVNKHTKDQGQSLAQKWLYLYEGQVLAYRASQLAQNKNNNKDKEIKKYLGYAYNKYIQAIEAHTTKTSHILAYIYFETRV